MSHPQHTASARLLSKQGVFLKYVSSSDDAWYPLANNIPSAKGGPPGKSGEIRIDFAQSDQTAFFVHVRFGVEAEFHAGWLVSSVLCPLKVCGIIVE